MPLVQRDVGGTGEVAVDNGGQTLDVRTEHLGHGFLLGFAQLREFLGHMRYRAVVLADLHTLDRAADPRRRGA